MDITNTRDLSETLPVEAEYNTYDTPRKLLRDNRNLYRPVFAACIDVYWFTMQRPVCELPRGIESIKRGNKKEKTEGDA